VYTSKEGRERGKEGLKIGELGGAHTCIVKFVSFSHTLVSFSVV